MVRLLNSFRDVHCIDTMQYEEHEERIFCTCSIFPASDFGTKRLVPRMAGQSKRTTPSAYSSFILSSPISPRPSFFTATTSAGGWAWTPSAALPETCLFYAAAITTRLIAETLFVSRPDWRAENKSTRRPRRAAIFRGCGPNGEVWSPPRAGSRPYTFFLPFLQKSCSYSIACTFLH